MGELTENWVHLETILLCLLVIGSVWIWTMPFQNDEHPFGEVDSAAHFALGDAMGSANTPIVQLPFYIDKRYGNDNTFKPHSLFYHPPFHVNFAIMQLLTRERFLPIFLLNALMSS